jgi:hypothetical protein
MICRFFHRVVAVNLALCMILHSMGSTPGAYLCIGCDTQANVIAVATAACETSSYPCCGDTPPTEGEQDENSDCDCIDFALAIHEGTTVQSGQKVAMTSPAGVPLLNEFAPLGIDVLRAAPRIPATPLLIRQLHPPALRTVLLI